MKPLKGVTVLDLSRLLPGGYASLLLVELGARVIKVEQPGVGDYYRAVPGSPALLGDQVSVINQGKESLGLDLKSADGRAVFEKLLRKADVVLESFRPGVLAKLGLGYARLKKIRPSIVLCSVTGFGQKGSKAHLAGHDLNFLGLSGLAARIRGRSGAPRIPDFQIADLAAGYEAALQIAAALAGRGKTRKGVHLDVTMDGAASSMSRLYAGPTPLSGDLARYGIYETADGGLMTLGALEPKFWSKFCRLVGAPESASREELERIFRSKPSAEWTGLGEREDICLFPVRDRSPRPAPKKTFPPLGTHTVSLLRKLGYTSSQIRSLKERGVVA
ncbi:MAG TPA: CaiB/BaiF CoA-transferase family protein [bacterium]|nr:CaiB/BaiF CoA-transferase family protein [bacterium]